MNNSEKTNLINKLNNTNIDDIITNLDNNKILQIYTVLSELNCTNCNKDIIRHNICQTCKRAKCIVLNMNIEPFTRVCLECLQDKLFTISTEDLIGTADNITDEIIYYIKLTCENCTTYIPISNIISHNNITYDELIEILKNNNIINN